MTLKILLFFVILVLPSFALAQDNLSEVRSFNIESSYDLSKRSELSAILIKVSSKLYWYADNDWWGKLTSEEQDNAKASLNVLTEEFENKIYPILTSVFGSEWNPGIDKDTRIAILLHPMNKNFGGYTNTSDEYPKIQIPRSNEREMIYLNSDYLNMEIIQSFLAHEFVHLITFNQKDRIFNVSEDVWLNEAMAEYASTLLGYDSNYNGTNLQIRVKDFLNYPFDSLTEWRESPADYGVANLFIQYLVDHYGVKILTDSLKMRKTGISSLNAALLQNGFQTDYSQIFTEWAIATLINDCAISEKYCYFNNNLKDLRVTPFLNYLPLVGDSLLSVNNATKDWAGNWHKFVGGQGVFKLKFDGSSDVNFKVPYIVTNSKGEYSVGSLTLDQNKDGEIVLDDFGSQVVSLMIIPMAQNKNSDFLGIQPSYSFLWSASAQKEQDESPILFPPIKSISQMSKEEIIARISEIKNLILQLQSQLAALTGSVSCSQITQNLYFGMTDNSQVKCLQGFLKSQGSGIYPEGIANGNFYSLTQKAVIRFQEKYASEILAPAGETKGTGYVGPLTRAKVNELLTR